MTQTYKGSPSGGSVRVPEPHEFAQPIPAPAPVAVKPPVDPGLIGMPAFIVGSLALALVDLEFTPATALFAAIPIILTATFLGQMVAALWAIRLGEGVSAAINFTFAGFWASYAVLSLGLAHNWFLIGPLGVHRTQETFLIAWLVVIGLLLIASIRLPMIITALLALVEVAFFLSYLGVMNLNANMTKASGWVILGFCAIGGYLFLSAMNVASGGKPYWMGKPLVR